MSDRNDLKMLEWIKIDKDRKIEFVVPSTDFAEAISDSKFDSRVKEARTFVDELFGGDTTISSVGGWFDSKGNWVSERSALISVFASSEELRRKDIKFLSWIKSKLKDWKQEEIFIVLDDDASFVSEKSTFDCVHCGKQVN